MSDLVIAKSRTAGAVPMILPDLMAHDLRVIFVGTASGKASALRQAYYAGPGNKFWPILAKTGMTSRQLAPDEYPELLKIGIGLTDVVKDQSGSDKDISMPAHQGKIFRERLMEFSPRVIAFNGKTAAKWALQIREVSYGEVRERWNTSRLFVLPSTSGAANGHWDERWWWTLAEILHNGETS